MTGAPDWLIEARGKWTNRGRSRPSFALDPGPGQESVWDYPRPPAVVADHRHIVVGEPSAPVADSQRSVRVLETSHPPTFYLPPESIRPGSLHVVTGASHCEWKGHAEYLALRPGGDPVGWRYPQPYPEFAEQAGWVAFYPGRIRCSVDGEVARPQAGGFYGGWITNDVVGPFKGGPDTSGW